jgi:hypothetical protein
LLVHQGDLVFHAQEHAAEVHAHDPVPFLGREIGSRRYRLFGASVVEGEVEPPKRIDRLVQRSLNILGPSHVAPDGERSRT